MGYSLYCLLAATEYRSREGSQPIHKFGELLQESLILQVHVFKRRPGSFVSMVELLERAS